MTKVVYPAPVYSFLGFIQRYQRLLDEKIGNRILDCGCGGNRPPLGLFHEHGFDVWGIDISEDQIEAAKEFFEEHNMEVHLSTGDMREIPYEDNSFDYVYEYYSMVHLPKEEIQKAIEEMKRVLRPNGLLFIGFMSEDTWPIEGEEKDPGEFWLYEHSDEEVVHSIFEDDEAEDYLAGLEVMIRNEITTSMPFFMADISQEEWIERYSDNWSEYSRQEWEDMYKKRIKDQKYSHIFYILRLVPDDKK